MVTQLKPALAGFNEKSIEMPVDSSIFYCSVT
jgi:hypothetical protein